MNCKIETYPPFDKAFKRLGKRYKSLKEDLANFVRELRDDPKMGVDLGDGFRKVRLRISSKGKGKSGGARVITCVVEFSQEEAKVALVYIYDKSECSSIFDKELKELKRSCGL